MRTGELGSAYSQSCVSMLCPRADVQLVENLASRYHLMRWNDLILEPARLLHATAFFGLLDVERHLPQSHFLLVLGR